MGRLQKEQRCPVLIFAGASDDVQQRKEEVLSLGAHNYAVREDVLLEDLHKLFAPAFKTM